MLLGFFLSKKIKQKFLSQALCIAINTNQPTKENA